MMDYSEENILTKSAVFIIYENGEYLIIPKIKGLDYHINYIDYEIKNNDNLRLAKILEYCDVKAVLDEPYKFSIIINELTSKGNIILTNFACNYMGSTNYFGAYIPEKISDSQKETIKDLEMFIKELEFDHIAQYNLEYKRAKTLASVDFLETVNLKNNR